jgi:(2Fe-2S) ferredoxin
MSKHQQASAIPIDGWFLGWADDATPHRRCRLATTNGETIIKIAKSLRERVQIWQPGTWLSLQGKESGRGIKIDRIVPPTPNKTLKKAPEKPPVLPVKVKVCNGKACQRRGSANICQAIEGEIAAAGMTCQIETVKCLDRCKHSPHLLIDDLDRGGKQGRQHYQKVTPVEAIAIITACLPAQTAENNRYNKSEIQHSDLINNPSLNRLELEWAIESAIGTTESTIIDRSA